MKCPECQLLRPWQWFAPAAWCGSPDVRHALCAACQEQQRLVWAKRLELFFDRLYKPTVAAA